MQTSQPIAIVGMSALFAGSDDVVGFWRDVVSATDRLTDVPPQHWLIEDYYDPDPSAPDMTYAKRGGFLSGVPFDSMEFGIPPTAIPATDSAQLLALIAAKRVLADAARFREGEVDHARTSVILGVASATELVVQMGSRLQHPIWRKALRDAGLPESKVQEVVKRIGDHYQPWQESTFPGLLGNVVAGRIANRLDLGGSNFVTDAACASSMSALHAGLSELYLGDSDMVIAGGVDALNDILMYMCFSKTPAFSPTGDCRPFSDEADGTLIGEGVGMLALRRLEDAEADGDPIYAVIRGLGASSDGRGASVYAPRPEGQAKALRRAYDHAGYSPATVELVEAHGTATKAGDAAEVRGLTSVFGPADPDGRAWCALGSVKSQIGHTKAAAGSAGLIKVALALRDRVLPPTLKVSRPNAQLGIDDSPFYINTEARPWIRGGDHPRRASVSSFGFGGSNFHVALEEYTGPGRGAERLRVWPEELIVLSAPGDGELRQRIASVRERVDAGASLARIAHETTAGFDASAEVRLAIVAADTGELTAKLARAEEAIASGATGEIRDPDVRYGRGTPAPGRTAFLFPGQGSQYVGMGGPVAMAFDAAREVWDRAADMEAFADARLDRAVFPPPAFSDEERRRQQEAVTRMDVAQPAIAAVSLGYLALLERLGLRPDVVAGHSFGEVSALAAAGRIDSDELLTIARTRGRLMAEAAASRAGAMAAVISSAERVAEVLGDGADVVIANDNAPNEVVIAGAAEAVAGACERLSEAGLRTIALPVASAFHSSIVAESCEPFHAYLESLAWADGEVEVYANLDASPYAADAAAARRTLADQLASPVRFRDMVEAMYEAGATRFVEVGPASVLTKLVGRCLGDRPHAAVALDDKRVAGLRPLWRALGTLVADGVPLDLAALATGYREPTEPEQPKKHAIVVTGANHEKPYPPAEGAAGLPGPNPETVAAPAPPPSRQAPAANGAPGQSPRSAPHETLAFEGAPAPLQTMNEPGPSPTPTSPTASNGSGVVPSMPTPLDAAELARVHEITIEAHQRYQELMADSHQTFLRMASEVVAQLRGGVATGAAPAGAAEPARPVAPARDWPVPVQPTQPVAEAPPARAVPPRPSAAPTAHPATAQPAAAEAVPPAQPAAPVVDVTALALEVVSEKTGYPVEMLDLDMEMEAGLGIDSIKQVEILSELQERVPGMPEIEPSELASLRTLRDVADKLRPASAPVGRPAGAEAGDRLVSSSAGAQDPDVTSSVSSFVPRLTPELRPGFGLAALSRGATVQVTNELPALAVELVEGLRERGVTAEVVDAVTPTAAVISLAGLAGGDLGPEASITMHQRAIGAARVVAQHPDPSDRLFVTIQSTGGDFGLGSDPGRAAWLAGLPGIVKTAAREWPGASLKAIDVEDPGTAASTILDELFHGGPALEVGISAEGSRGVVRIEPVELAGTSTPALEPGAVVVVSGGARGVTASSVARLAEGWGVRLALLGRSQLGEWPQGVPLTTDTVELTGALAAAAKERGEAVDLAALQAQARSLAASAEVRLSLADLDARGIETLYLSADVTDPAQVKLALDHVRETWGPIAGIVHGAGVLRDKAIADVTPDRVETVFSPKVRGLATLLEATADDPIQVIALFSSIAARSGNAGQVAYAAANEVLNKVAAAEAARRGAACRVRSYNWGPWAGGMVDAGLAAHFEKQGIALLSIEAGTRYFVEELGESGTGVERVVLAAPSFPRGTHHLTLSAESEEEVAVWDRVGVLAPAFAADLALRLGQALKPMRTMRTHLQQLVIAKLGGEPVAAAGVHAVDIVPVDGEVAGYRMVFRDAEGRAHHETLLLYSEDGAEPLTPVVAGEMEPWPMEADAAYETVLGRTDGFRPIAELEGVSEEGGVALLRTRGGLGWSTKGLDAAMLDGLVQLGELWTHHKAGAVQSLQRMGSIVVHHLEGLPERLRSAFQVRRTDTGTLFDFVLATEDGDLVAEIREVEFDALGA